MTAALAMVTVMKTDERSSAIALLVPLLVAVTAGGAVFNRVFSDSRTPYGNVGRSQWTITKHQTKWRVFSNNPRRKRLEKSKQKGLAS